MAPEMFRQIVEEQQTALTTGPDGPLLVMGATEQGEQIAVLRGRREEDETAQFLVVTAPNTNARSKQVATEVIPVGSLAVYHPSIENGSRSGWYIELGDERRIRFPSEKARAAGTLVHIGDTAVHSEVTAQRSRRRTRSSVEAKAV